MVARARRVGWVIALLLTASGCSPITEANPASAIRLAEPPFVVPGRLAKKILPRRRIASGLANPRGMLAQSNGSLLVNVAGTGEGNTGALLLLQDRNGDGSFDDAGERTALLSNRRSANAVDLVRRDEVFGMAGLARGAGTILASQAFFFGPSDIFRIDGRSVDEWGHVKANINALDYDPMRDAWFATSSSADEIVRLLPGRPAQRVVKLPKLEGGQDSVPGYLRHDPRSGKLLVSLFSGSTEGEAGGDGTELVLGSGLLIHVDPDNGQVTSVVTGLTAPTDVVIDTDGRIYVLEFCDRFLDPIDGPENLKRTPGHGGFRRFSGRLLRIDRKENEVTVLAESLDAPTNLALNGNTLLIAQGMGTPGRMIPGPSGTVPLEGYIEAIDLR
jgi:hypothetical protein